MLFCFLKSRRYYTDAYSNYIDTTTLIANYEAASESLISKDKKKMNKAFTELKANFVTAGKSTNKELGKILEEQARTAEVSYTKIAKAYDNGEKGVTKKSVENAKNLRNTAYAEWNKFEEGSSE